ncbi:MAG: Gfo/Idh/MocA family oxidoreductase [Deferribacteres bacterium]|nr:Gfo/Idh/MocA family oxidoreductase [candidate division KSB1 bacterium]MCB9502040.1 Gfo/Idh/MocA family oxidoreductase [Deferribacteres bacterium]
MNRREFIATTGLATGALAVSPSSLFANNLKGTKMRLALVGTGIRGTGMWGRSVVQEFSDLVEFVGLCDVNPGRLEYAKKYMGVNCPVYTDFDKMMKEVKPDRVIVTTVDATHNEFIIKALKMGADVMTEKPMTTDEFKCQAILDAERESGKKVIVTFNYRYSPYMTKVKELLQSKRIGDIVSVDFHWYLNVYHGASYFRRWHGLRDKSGTLLVHKATHHFDLLNWWLDSEPEQVYAWGDLEFYGKNHDFRGQKCRGCEYVDKCKFYWDITQDKRLMDLYVANEQHDGYIRDKCLWRNEIDIYDKMAAQIKYANNVFTSYSLTTYSPYEGWRIAFNGTKGRIDAWEDVPWESDIKLNQSELHAQDMNQDLKEEAKSYDLIMVSDNFKSYTPVKVPKPTGGHGGGDERLRDHIFRNPEKPDPFRHAAGTRDGSMSILIGIAARNSIESGKPVKIGDLTDLKPMPVRPTK